MNIAGFAVRRPVFTSMATCVVILLGFVSLSRLPIDLMPDITLPTLSIITTYENSSPTEIEELITRPIEEAMSAVPGVEEVTSISSEGSSSVRVTFTWGTDIDAAANDVRDRLDRVAPRLPDEADRPVLRKFDLAGFPVLILGASSKLDPIQTRRIIDEQIKYRLERIPGVASLDVWGGLEREIHVNLEADKMKSLNIPVDQIVARILSANLTLPAGSIESGHHDITIRTPGEFQRLDQLATTTVAVREGVPVRLADISSVQDSWQKVTRIVRVNGVPGIRLSISKQSGTNTVQVAERALREIALINQDIPQVQLTPIIDTSDYIKRSITNVGLSATYGGLFAVFVLLLFLRNIRSTIIIALAIPVSIVATFALVYFGGFTLNLMTLGGLALGVGMLVDNAIVVLENIYRHREAAEGSHNAAIRGTQDVAAAIIASTLTTLAVFLPLVFVRGMAGVMFKQMAYVVGFSLLCSLGVALTLIPMLAARFLRLPEQKTAGHFNLSRRLFTFTGNLLNGLETEYQAILRWSLRHRIFVLFLTLCLLVGSLSLVPYIGVEMMPSTDEGEVRVTVEMEVGTRLSILDKTFDPIEQIVIRDVPEMKSMVSSLGGSVWRGSESHSGDIRIALTPARERDRSSQDIANALRKPLSAIPGAQVRTREGQGLFILNRVMGGVEQLQIEIRGFDMDTAGALAEQVKHLVEDIPGVTDARSSRKTGSPERLIQVDRQKAETMNVTVSQVAETLQIILSGKRAGYYREGGDEYAIRVQLDEADQLSLAEILDFTLTNANGEPVVLRNIVDISAKTGPVQVERKNQERIVLVSANIHDRDLGSIVRDARRKLAEIPVPSGFTIGFGGDYEEQRKAFNELLLGLVLALLLVYMVMACLYESFRQPFVVMFSVPLAVIGVILILLLTDTTFNIQTYIGCIMLGGIVVNNAILLVDQTNRLYRHQDMELKPALMEAGRKRLRPILMTAMTTIFGLIPLAIGLNEGGEAQAPMARAVIGGLFSSTLITLVVVPVIYSFIEGPRRGVTK
jgi:hydrophobic/amphiphilic exporter-1 (mainly G- bacteria), HAE1 family